MTQSVVTIRLNGHPYQIGCEEGEENHVAKLGAEVEAVMQSLIASVGQIGEARLLAMVALILADRAESASTLNTGTDAESASSGPPSNMVTGDDLAAEALEDAAEQIVVLATRLASGTTRL